MAWSRYRRKSDDAIVPLRPLVYGESLDGIDIKGPVEKIVEWDDDAKIGAYEDGRLYCISGDRFLMQYDIDPVDEG